MDVCFVCFFFKSHFYRLLFRLFNFYTFSLLVWRQMAFWLKHGHSRIHCKTTSSRTSPFCRYQMLDLVDDARRVVCWKSHFLTEFFSASLFLCVLSFGTISEGFLLEMWSLGDPLQEYKPLLGGWFNRWRSNVCLLKSYLLQSSFRLLYFYAFVLLVYHQKAF